MTKNITVKYETAPGTKVDGGYFVPDIYVNVKRKGFIGWLFRLFGSRRGYEEKKMYEALLDEQVSIGKAVRVNPGTIKVETVNYCENITVTDEIAADIDEFNKYFDGLFSGEIWRKND